MELLRLLVFNPICIFSALIAAIVIVRREFTPHRFLHAAVPPFCLILLYVFVFVSSIYCVGSSVCQILFGNGEGFTIATFAIVIAYSFLGATILPATVGWLLGVTSGSLIRLTVGGLFSFWKNRPGK